MKLTIFTGTTDGDRFFDSFLDGDGFTDEEYADCTRYDYEIADDEIEAKANEFGADLDNFSGCLAGVSHSDLKRFVHGAYRGQLDRELISDAVETALRKLAVDDIVDDCLTEVKKNYNCQFWLNR